MDLNLLIDIFLLIGKLFAEGILDVQLALVYDQMPELYRNWSLF